MKKNLLLFLLFLMSFVCVDAQNEVSTNNLNAYKIEGAISKLSNEISTSIRKVPVRKTLAENQQYMGAYTTDDYLSYGLGLTAYPGTYKMYADIPSNLLGAYDNGKVVGMRFAVAEACNTTKCFIYNYTESGLTLLAEGKVTSSEAGWNTVMFDTPFTLDLSTIGSLMMGYDYEQTSSNYPIAVADAGVICPTYVYGDLGSGTEFYTLGFENYGNLCVQAIVEKEYAKNGVGGFSCNDVYVQKGEAANLNVYLQNWGTESVKNIAYTVTCDGTTSKEQTINLYEACKEFGGLFTVTVPVEAQAEACTKNYTITVTKVNGVANEYANNTVNATVVSIKEIFPHHVVMEEYTGTGCGYCPRGWVALNLLNEKYGADYIGISIHQYNSSDPMYLSTSSYASLGFTGAPSVMVERGNELDPWYGSSGSTKLGIYDDIDAALAEIAPVGVEVEGILSDDLETVEATAKLKSIFDDKTYNIEYVLTADSLYNSTWAQSNYYYQYTAANADALGTPLEDFCSGGTYGNSSVKGLYFSDVAIASSYKSSKNQAEPVVCTTAYEPVESSCTLSLPTKTALKTAIQNADYNVSVIALVIDPTTGKIVNAAKCRAVTKNVVLAQGITLDKNNLSLEAEETDTLTATVYPSNVTDNSVTWKSSNESVATVKDGVVTAINGGTAIITVTTADGSNKSATCTVSVKPTLVESVTLNKHDASINVGDTFTLTATVLPSNATNKNIVWSTSNSKIATVDTKGKVTGIGVGSATITATTADGTEISDNCLVTVNPVYVQSMTLTPSSATIKIDEKVTLTANITPTNATYQEVTWSSDNTDVATVNNGIVTGVSEGEATIIARATDGSGIYATSKITVIPVVATALKLSETEADVVIGTKITITAIFTPTNTTNKNLVWTSSDESIAVVDNGTITGVSVGTAKISATTTDGSNITASCTVNVLPKQATSLTLDKTTLTLKPGEDAYLTATILPSDATYKDVIWKSSDESIATVDEGHVVAIAPGQATVSARTTDGSNLTANCEVIVNQISVISITFDKSSVTMEEGTTLQLTPIVKPEDATYPELSWESSDTNVATVNDGLVFAVEEGASIITAKSTDGSNVSGQCIVIVTNTDGIFNISIMDNVEGVYTLDGKKVESMHRGVYIVRFNDGKTKTVTVK